MRKVELGSGIERREGYIGIDKEDYGQEYVRDVEKGLPFDDNSVDAYFAQHLFEHIHDFLFLMEEIYRTLKPGGILEVVVPHKDSSSMFKDPTHIRIFDDYSFDYWVPGIVHFRPKNVKAHFEIISKSFDSMKHMYVMLKALK
jgi:ubiquinone/menaquinone biosynthesis C-methylase UbiE